ncbi:hypothetical protein SRB17_02770 [Streptomyces sp. RB17]|uniref:DUF397 domain-containing protein n=1 Tax=Streptomyces sp. RB17 TaxID=2585197 RepID=UPI00129730E4|nr:DUF397 domain-containing protein [Streptomyces sp. RB17]MQY32329.1 hypothetical protein [Streptomyces sp. RB17]
MSTRSPWRKSSYSGGGEGNACVEVADLHTHIAIRDSKAPAGAALTFPATAFAPFLDALKKTGGAAPLCAITVLPSQVV